MILVTGGCGFIGNQLINYLVKNYPKHRLHVLDNLTTAMVRQPPAGVKFSQGDIRDKALVERLMQKATHCIHLAAKTNVRLCEEEAVNCFDINVNGSDIIFKLAAKYSVQVIFSSSAAVYGEIPSGVRSVVGRHCTPQSVYGESKLAMEKLAKFYKKSRNLKFTGFRFFNVYGFPFRPFPENTAVIPAFIHSAINNIPYSIYGDGTAVRDFIHLSDVVRVLGNALGNPRFLQQILNLGTGVGVTIRELAFKINTLFGENEFQFHVQNKRPADSEILYSVAEMSALCMPYSKFNFISLDVGLREIKHQLQLVNSLFPSGS